MRDDISDQDREAILDARSDGASIAAIARRFNMVEHEVRDILRQEVARYSDGDFLRERWTLTIRGLEQIESKFRRKGLDELNEAAAMVAIRANERRASLTGAGQTTIQLMMAPAPVKRQLSIEDLIQRHKRLNSALGVQGDDATVERAVLAVHSVEKPDDEAEQH